MLKEAGSRNYSAVRLSVRPSFRRGDKSKPHCLGGGHTIVKGVVGDDARYLNGAYAGVYGYVHKRWDALGCQHRRGCRWDATVVQRCFRNDTLPGMAEVGVERLPLSIVPASLQPLQACLNIWGVKVLTYIAVHAHSN